MDPRLKHLIMNSRLEGTPMTTMRTPSRGGSKRGGAYSYSNYSPNPWLDFLNQNRDYYASRHPNLSGAEVVKALARIYRGGARKRPKRRSGSKVLKRKLSRKPGVKRRKSLTKRKAMHRIKKRKLAKRGKKNLKSKNKIESTAKKVLTILGSLQIKLDPEDIKALKNMLSQNRSELETPESRDQLARVAAQAIIDNLPRVRANIPQGMETPPEPVGPFGPLLRRDAPIAEVSTPSHRIAPPRMPPPPVPPRDDDILVPRIPPPVPPRMPRPPLVEEEEEEEDEEEEDPRRSLLSAVAPQAVPEEETEPIERRGLDSIRRRGERPIVPRPVEITRPSPEEEALIIEEMLRREGLDRRSSLPQLVREQGDFSPVPERRSPGRQTLDVVPMTEAEKEVQEFERNMNELYGTGYYRIPDYGYNRDYPRNMGTRGGTRKKSKARKRRQKERQELEKLAREMAFAEIFRQEDELNRDIDRQMFERSREADAEAQYYLERGIQDPWAPAINVEPDVDENIRRAYEITPTRRELREGIDQDALINRNPERYTDYIDSINDFYRRRQLAINRALSDAEYEAMTDEQREAEQRERRQRQRENLQRGRELQASLGIEPPVRPQRSEEERQARREARRAARREREEQQEARYRALQERIGSQGEEPEERDILEDYPAFQRRGRQNQDPDDDESNVGSGYTAPNARGPMLDHLGHPMQMGPVRYIPLPEDDEGLTIEIEEEEPEDEEVWGDPQYQERARIYRDMIINTRYVDNHRFL